MTGKGPGPGQRLLWVLAVLALVALPACGKKEPAAVMEGILVYQHKSNYYLYTKGEGGQIYTLPAQAPVPEGELAVGQKVKVNYDGSVMEIAPPALGEIDSIDILGQAAEEEFQAALDHFNTEVKPWHLDGEGERP